MLTEIKEVTAEASTTFDTGWLTTTKTGSGNTYFLDNYEIAGGTEPTIVLVDFCYAHNSNFPMNHLYCQAKQNGSALAADTAFGNFNQWALQRGTTGYPYQSNLSGTTALRSGTVWRYSGASSSQNFLQVLPNGERAFSYAPLSTGELTVYVNSSAFNSTYYLRARGYTLSKAQEIFK
jgi:hypothetical protein